MLAEIGAPDTDALFADIPPAVRLKRPLDLPAPLSEMEILDHVKRLGARNADLEHNACFLGCGAYDHYLNAVMRAAGGERVSQA